LARADPVPSEPGPGEIFNEGANCHVAWTPDPTGLWKVTNIELMTGSNTNMVHLTTVATVDSTGTTTSFDYPCPAVTINSDIYFYQFTSPAAPNRTWTTRFTIAGTNGETVAPPNAVEPNGQAVPWGNGALTDPSTATAAPSYLTGGSSSSAPASSGSASVSAAPSSSSAPVPSVAPSSSTSGFATVSSTPSATASSSPDSTAANSTTSGAAQ
ncbi:hypothetical protein FA95DRAFT_1472117, partial [Auriscalpium vulgare]